MTFNYLLDCIIQEETEVVKRVYKDSPMEMEGGLEALKECANKTIAQLKALHKKAYDELHVALREDTADYGRFMARAIQIEWVCNCVSVLQKSSGDDAIIDSPTTRAAEKVFAIVGGKLPDDWAELKKPTQVEKPLGSKES